MSAPVPYLHLPGTAREALTFYAQIFGGRVRLNTFADMGRSDAPEDAIAHGDVVDGPVQLFASDVGADETSFKSEGLMFALLGSARPTVLRDWFQQLSDGGTVVDNLRARPWNAWDGQVIDRYGIHWLIGFEGDPDS